MANSLVHEGTGGLWWIAPNVVIVAAFAGGLSWVGASSAGSILRPGGLAWVGSGQLP